MIDRNKIGISMIAVVGDAGEMKGKIYLNKQANRSILSFVKTGDPLERMIVSYKKMYLLALFQKILNSENQEETFEFWIDKIDTRNSYKRDNYVMTFCISPN